MNIFYLADVFPYQMFFVYLQCLKRNKIRYCITKFYKEEKNMNTVIALTLWIIAVYCVYNTFYRNLK